MHDLSALIGVGLTVVACGLGLVKGGLAERYGGTFLFVAWISWNLIYAESNGHPPTTALFASDVVVLFAFAGLAFYSRKGWAVIAALFQSVGAIAHVARIAGLDVHQPAFVAALDIAAAGIRLALIAGTVIAWREREALKAFGIVDQADASSPAKARSMSSSVRPTPKMATKDPKRGPWF